MYHDADMEKWIENKISAMTLDEKIGFIHGAALFKNKGIDRLGIQPLVMSDGPCGVRFDHKDDEWVQVDEPMCYVSWLPSGAAMASTWNEDIAARLGEVLGNEACGRGKQVILAPGINIVRTPLCGRNFEYMSEDPCLAGKMAAAEIQGVQSQNVAVCVKHFALNNQEKERMKVDVRVDDRTLHELYLPAFKTAVEEGGAYSVMCSYNKINGLYASENETLLNDILKNDWGYDGVVISDWGAVHSTAAAALAGTDLEMSVTNNFDEYFFADALKEAVRAGDIAEDVIDDKVARILRLQKRIRLYDGERNKGGYNLPEHHTVMLDAAREGVVLLKNERGILPLNADKCKTIAVIGDAAVRKLAHGGGSSEIKPLFEITPLMGINMVTGSRTVVKYAKGYYVDNEEHVVGEVDWQANSLDAPADRTGDTAGVQGEGNDNEASGTDQADNDKSGCVDKISCEEKPGCADKISNGEETGSIEKLRRQYLEEAVALARECDAVIYVGGLNRAYDTEGFDRTSYELPYKQAEVINALLAANPNTVVSILSGSAVDMSAFEKNAPAILWNSMNGMQAGLALAEVIFGDVNPSGKLPVSFPFRLSDCPAHGIGEYPGTYDGDGGITCSYSEGIYVGYRHYSTRNIDVLFPFGHGLSYTTFEYGNIKAVKCKDEDAFEVTFEITNTGSVFGKETAEVYVGAHDPVIDRPALELKGFKKVGFEPGECRSVTIKLDRKAFAYYSVSDGTFRADSGKYTISAGRSVKDLRVSCDVVL